MRARLLIAVALLAPPAGAASRVTIVRPPAIDAEHAVTLVRLRAELGAAGFDVVDVDGEDGDPRTQVEQGDTRDSFATIVLVPGAGGAAVDVWIADHVTRKTVVRTIRVAPTDRDASSLVAVRAVELLRASLLETREFSPVGDHEARR